VLKRPSEVVGLGVKADADPVATRPHRPLRWSALLREMGATGMAVVRVRGNSADAGQPRVYHEGDAGDGEGGFATLVATTDLATRGAVEHPALLGRGEPGKKRQHQRAGRAGARDHFAGLADVLLGGHEDEDVPWEPFLLDAAHGAHGLFDGGEIVPSPPAVSGGS